MLLAFLLTTYCAATICIELDSDVLGDALDFLSFKEELIVRLVNRKFNYIFNRPEGKQKLINDISALQKFSKTIFNQIISPHLIKQIKQIHSDYNLDPLYRQKLIFILRDFYFHSKQALNSTIGLYNLRTFMNLLRIFPMTSDELTEEELWDLPCHIQLLLILSRAIAHPFIFSNSKVLNTNNNETASFFLDVTPVDKSYFNYSFGVINYYGIYPESNPADYIVFKIMYDHVLEYSCFGDDSYLLWRRQKSHDELVYLNGSRWQQMIRFQFLMNKFKYIPWCLPPVEIVDDMMVRSVIHAYDSILDITFTVLLADYYFDDDFFIDMHTMFVCTVLQNEKASFSDLGMTPRLFEIFRDILKRVLINLVTHHSHHQAEFRKIINLVYQRKGEVILEALAEFIAAIDNGYYYVFMDVLMEINPHRFGHLNNSEHYMQSKIFAEWAGYE